MLLNDPFIQWDLLQYLMGSTLIPRLGELSDFPALQLLCKRFFFGSCSFLASCNFPFHTQDWNLVQKIQGRNTYSHFWRFFIPDLFSPIHRLTNFSCLSTPEFQSIFSCTVAENCPQTNSQGTSSAHLVCFPLLIEHSPVLPGVQFVSFRILYLLDVYN